MADDEQSRPGRGDAILVTSVTGHRERAILFGAGYALDPHGAEICEVIDGRVKRRRVRVEDIELDTDQELTGDLAVCSSVIRLGGDPTCNPEREIERVAGVLRKFFPARSDELEAFAEQEPVPRNAFVALLDILAFRRLGQEKGTAGLHRLFRRGLLMAIQQSAYGRLQLVHQPDGNTVAMPVAVDNLVQLRVFSDTVVFFTPDDSGQSFTRLVGSVQRLMSFGLAGLKTPFRGAIGYGDLIVDEPIVVGSAVVDAYEQGQDQGWAGCLITPACEAFASERGYLEGLGEDVLLRLDVPARKPSVSRSAFVINWTTGLSEGATERSFFAPDNDAQLRYIENTRNFERVARARTGGTDVETR